MEYLAEIKRAIAGLRELDIKHDPLFDAYRMADAAFIDSARKRHGLIIEAAFRDAFVSQGVDCRKYSAEEAGIEIDAVIKMPSRSVIIGVDVKRGTSFHDSGKKRSMQEDVPRAREALAKIAKTHDMEAADIFFGFYHHYSQGNRGHVEAITALEIDYLTGVNVRPTIEKATEIYRNNLDDYATQQI